MFQFLKFLALTPILLNAASARAFNAQILLDLHCRQQHDHMGDDEIYVVSSVARTHGPSESRLIWTGDMNDDGHLRNMNNLVVWAGALAPGETIAASVHVFELNSRTLNAGLSFGRSLAAEAQQSITQVPFSMDLMTYLNQLNLPYLADRAFNSYIRGDADSYPGTYTIMMNSNPYGAPGYFFHSTYRSGWAGDHMLLSGDGAAYEARTRVFTY